MSESIATDAVFSADELQTLRTIAGLIVPPSAAHGVPGADDEVVFADIAATAAGSREEVRRAAAYAQSLEGPLAEHVEDLQANPDIVAFTAITLQCYYRDDRVMQSLGMEARAPFPKGFEVAQGDWSILESVQQRGKIWRDA